MRKNSKPEFMITYQCLKCGMDFAVTEKDWPKCFYCDSQGDYLILKKEKITPEVMVRRLKIVTDRMMENLRKARKIRPQDINPDFDSEKMLLDVMAKVKKLKDNVQSLKLKSAKNRKKNKSVLLDEKADKS